MKESSDLKHIFKSRGISDFSLTSNHFLGSDVLLDKSHPVSLLSIPVSAHTCHWTLRGKGETGKWGAPARSVVLAPLLCSPDLISIVRPRPSRISPRLIFQGGISLLKGLLSLSLLLPPLQEMLKVSSYLFLELS